MTKTVLCLLAVTTCLLYSCLKKDTGCGYNDKNIVAPASEQQALDDYISTNNITATKHSNGMYYQILDAGTGSAAPGLCSTVWVEYKGSLTNGTVFDSTVNAITFTLGGLIEGWRKGIPLVKKGGHIILYLPPTLGYGSASYGNIPGNSILIFDIRLNDYQ